MLNSVLCFFLTSDMKKPRNVLAVPSIELPEVNKLIKKVFKIIPKKKLEQSVEYESVNKVGKWLFYIKGNDVFFVLVTSDCAVKRGLEALDEYFLLYQEMVNGGRESDFVERVRRLMNKYNSVQTLNQQNIMSQQVEPNKTPSKSVFKTFFTKPNNQAIEDNSARQKTYTTNNNLELGVLPSNILNQPLQMQSNYPNPDNYSIEQQYEVGGNRYGVQSQSQNLIGDAPQQQPIPQYPRIDIDKQPQQVPKKKGGFKGFFNKMLGRKTSGSRKPKEEKSESRGRLKFFSKAYWSEFMLSYIAGFLAVFVIISLIVLLIKNKLQKGTKSSRNGNIIVFK